MAKRAEWLVSVPEAIRAYALANRISRAIQQKWLISQTEFYNRVEDREMPSKPSYENVTAKQSVLL